MRKLITFVCFAGLCAGFTACGGATKMNVVEAKLPTTDTGRCPIKVPETTFEQADADGGVAFTYTTAKGDVGDLRERVGFLSTAFNDYAKTHSGHDDRSGKMDGTSETSDDGSGAAAEGKSGKMDAGNDPKATAKVAEVENGATITLTPAGDTSIAVLKTYLAERAAAMKGGDCLMPSLAAK